MRKRSRARRSILASIVAVAMVGSLSFAPALASARQGGQDLAPGSVTAGVPEWAIDDGGAPEGKLSAQTVIPKQFDLRNEGVVTPVKFQNPWGSCWAFGGISAAEISLLSASGMKYGKKEDSEHIPLDLSERHLTYFALQPVTDKVNTDQVGEGLHAYEPSQEKLNDNPYASINAAFDAGGMPVYITTLFAQGVGPVAESQFHYRGASNMTTAEDFDKNDAHLVTETKDQLTMLAQSDGKTYEAFLQDQANSSGKTIEEVFDFYKQRVRAVMDEKTGVGSYTKYDDWSISETDDQGHANRLLSGGYMLKNGNVLPEYWGADKTQLQNTSVNAIKQELLNGRGVNIAFHADQSGQFTMSDKDENNQSIGNMYNQYVNQNLQINHGVCIVGWNDKYPKEAFATAAPDDGAWIVKNSWGSTKDAIADDLGHVTGKKNYGMKEGDEYTGFFYLSYYDQTITMAETMEFSANLGAGGTFAALQHDYLPASQGFYTTPASSDVMSSANVFSTEDTPIVVKSVSTRTAEANMRVTFAIYELSDNAKNPTDGTLLFRTSQNFEYGGYHRLDLDQPITFDKNKKFSVVSTASTLGENGARSYSASASQGLSKQAADYGRSIGISVKAYGVAVVNKGESYLYNNGVWQDWKDYLNTLAPSQEALSLLKTAEHYTDVFPIDNFSIKVYAEPVDDSQAKALEEAKKAQEAAEKEAAAAKAAIKADISGATVTVAKATYNKGKAVKPKVTVKLSGKTLKLGTDYKVSYVNNKKAGTAMAVVKGTGAYTGSAVKTFTINKAANTLKASGKTATVKASNVKKAKQTIAKAKAFSVTKAQGSVTFKKASGNAKITVSKAGVITVKKGLAKKTYKVKVKVTAAGNANYKKATKTVTVKVKVK